MPVAFRAGLQRTGEKKQNVPFFIGYHNRHMFTHLFKPKWEHADPRIRRQALSSGAAPPEVLAQAACMDEDPGVRRCAVERLTDPELLAELIGTEAETDLRQTAGRRLRDVLAEPLQAGAPLASRLAALQHAPSPELCTFLAREAQAAEIRSAALEVVQDTEILCAIAIDDPVASVRRAALERIGDPQGWETVARDARKKDKQVSRMARERLEDYRRAQAEQEAAERLCSEMEGLAAIPPGEDSQWLIRRITKRWESLQYGAETRVAERFVRARQQAEAASERFAAAMSERRSLCDELERLLDGTREDAGGEPPAAEGLLAALAQAVGRWQALEPVVEDDAPLAQHFSGLVKQVQGTAGRLAKDQARCVPLRDLVAWAAECLAEPAELDEHRVSEFEQRWARLEPPSSPRLAAALQEEFAVRRDALRKRLKQQASRRIQALEETESLLADMDGALREGELERALSLRDRIRHRLKIAQGSDERKRAALRRRLQRMQPRLEQLREWRHWGSGNARERLCSEIEALDGSALPVAEIATRVRTARESWKRIDRAEGPAREALWQRFDQACTRAYAPYRQERQEQAQQRAAHLERKQALCRELDTFERDTDWKNVDWRAADRQVRSARERWRRIGAVPTKARKALEKDYRAVLERLESHLDRERERELHRRRALITRVEQLAAAADPRSASREVKEAQKNWSPSVQATPAVEQALWKQFRKACDAVFSRVREEREAADGERQANLECRTTLCEELEALLDNTAVDFRSVMQRFAAAREAWTGMGAVPRRRERDLEARYAALAKRFTSRRRQEERAASEAVQQGLSERSRLCDRREAGVLESILVEAARHTLVEETRQAWEALAPLDARPEEGVRNRFELAGRALAGDAAARSELFDALPGNLERRRELCLQLEIAAGIDSPAGFSEARMQLQVARLANALGHRQEGADTGSAPLRELLTQWYRTGPVAVAERDALEARIARVLAVME